MNRYTIYLLKYFLILLFLTAAISCSNHINSSLRHNAITLELDDLKAGGLAFITPSTFTGQEEDKQNLAFIFSDVLKSSRKEVRCVSLAETLGAINRANLADEYKKMFVNNRTTGLFDRQTLKKIGEVTGVKYLAQIKLAGFSQKNATRWSVLGIRMIDTKRASIRVFLQVWDSSDGSIVWEGSDELDYAVDTFSEKLITFETLVKETAGHLVNRLFSPSFKDSVAEKDQVNFSTHLAISSNPPS